jgi:D-threo-aldose 1-dehydrogenase
MRFPELTQLGSSPLEVPFFGLGGAPLGDPHGPIPPQQAEQTLTTAWQHGVRYYDTAPWYGNTLSEHRMGHLLRNQPRESFVVSTKVGRVYSRPGDRASFSESRWMKRWPGGLPFDLRFDYTEPGIIRSYEDSLQRLGLNQVDSLVIHDLDLRHQTSREGIDSRFDELIDGGGMKALNELKRSGEIRAIGAGINHLGMIPLFLERTDIDFFILALPYTLADQSAMDDELPLCEKRNVSVVIGAVFGSGILATGPVANAQYGYQPAQDDMTKHVQALQSVAASHNVSLVSAALQFPLAHPAVAAVIPGANAPEQVEMNVKAMSEIIPADFWQELKARKLLRTDAPTPG